MVSAAAFKATEAFSRICTGQLMYAIEEGWKEAIWRFPREKIDQIEDLLKEVTSILSEGKVNGYSSNYGIYSNLIDEHASTSFNIKQVLRHQLWKEGGSVGYGVDSSVTICNGEQPVIIEKIED